MTFLYVSDMYFYNFLCQNTHWNPHKTLDWSFFLSLSFLSGAIPLKKTDPLFPGSEECWNFLIQGWVVKPIFFLYSGVD